MPACQWRLTFYALLHVKELQQFPLLDWCCSQLIQEGQTSCALNFDIDCESRCAQAAHASKEKITMNIL